MSIATAIAIRKKYQLCIPRNTVRLDVILNTPKGTQAQNKNVSRQCINHEL